MGYNPTWGTWGTLFLDHEFTAFIISHIDTNSHKKYTKFDKKIDRKIQSLQGLEAGLRFSYLRPDCQTSADNCV